MKLLAYLCGPAALEELYGIFSKGADGVAPAGREWSAGRRRSWNWTVSPK